LRAFVGPSGVGKTAFMRALGERHFSMWLEIPHPYLSGSRADGEASMKLGTYLLSSDFKHAVHLMFCFLLAKFIVFARLYADDPSVTPHAWLYAQLNGADAYVAGYIPTTTTADARTDIRFRSVSVTCSGQCEKCHHSFARLHSGYPREARQTILHFGGRGPVFVCLLDPLGLVHYNHSPYCYATSVFRERRCVYCRNFVGL